MEKKKEPSPLAIVWGWADKYHGKLYASVALAVLGVAEPCCRMCVSPQ